MVVAESVDCFDFVLFGATGDLASRKLIPALYRRFVNGNAFNDSRLIATSHRKMSSDAFREHARDAILEFVPDALIDDKNLPGFLAVIDYICVDATAEAGWPSLVETLAGTEERIRVFYLSVSPALFGPVSERLSNYGLVSARARIVVEKPLGHDLPSARELNQHLSSRFDESQIYRIDHYLGKETVQNLMALRFANALFEPLWNSRHIDHVQITVAESIGVEGRGGYYDQVGATRDMVQNHLLQLLCLTAMEPPNRFEPDAVRDEKLKVIKALSPINYDNINTDTVFGQYRAGTNSNDYLTDVENPQSRTECFVALKVNISNWRWSGTPFYLRTGKNMRARTSEIAVYFKDTPHSIFPPESGYFRSNALISRLQPDEGITLRMNIKDPGLGGMRLTEAPLDMTFSDKFSASATQMSNS